MAKISQFVGMTEKEWDESCTKIIKLFDSICIPRKYSFHLGYFLITDEGNPFEDIIIENVHFTKYYNKINKRYHCAIHYWKSDNFHRETEYHVKVFREKYDKLYNYEMLQLSNFKFCLYTCDSEEKIVYDNGQCLINKKLKIIYLMCYERNSQNNQHQTLFVDEIITTEI